MGFSKAIREALKGNGLITTFPDNAEAVSSNDSVIFAVPSIIWVNQSAVAVKVVPWGGGTAVTVSMATPGPVPFRVQKIVVAGTTATDMIRIYGPAQA